MRGNFKPARIRLIGLLLLFLITASGVFAYSAAKSHPAKLAISVETALKAIDFAAENDISIDSEFSANLRQSINFNRNRYYSPALGRFISKDPIGFNGGMNLYRYADNNPMSFVDPWGLFKYLGTNWIFDIAKAKQAKIEDLEAGQSWDIIKWYGKKVINANARGYARPSINIKKDVDSNCKIKIQTEMGITIYLPNIGEVAGSGVTDENLLKMIAEHEIGHEMMYRLIGERIFESLESIVNGKNLSSEEIDSKIKEAKSEFHDAIVEVDRNYHSGNPSRPFFEIDWSGFQK